MKMEKIKAALAALINEDNFETVTSDKGTLKWEGDEAIKVGDTITIVAEDGTESSAEDGEYVTAELKIEIENGAVKSIEEIEKEDETNKETVEEDNFAKKRVEAFELSYNEKERKIYDAIREKLGKDEYFYIVEAGDNYAVVVIYDEDYNEKYYRYELEWDGDDVKVVGDREEVKSAYIPVDEEAPLKEKPVEEKQDDAEERLKAIEERLDKIEEALKNIEPAKAEEQFAAINNFEAKNQKDERLKRMFNLQ